MIPRFKPCFGKDELLAALTPDMGAVERFETEFARVFRSKYALAFPYGRSALWAFFKAMNINDAEIIMPAYTCVVVAHAIILSGNRPKFVDITLHDYNMDLFHVAEAINENTRAIISTHLFGYPLDIDRLSEIVQKAEKRIGHKIWVIQDCAHSFGAEWKGRLVCNAGDAALFGLNISKMMTSIFGGMITTNDGNLNEKLKLYRDAHFKKTGFAKTLMRFLYLLSVYPAFHERVYGIVYWLQEKTTVLNRLTKAYHLDDKIHLPPDHVDQMMDMEAAVGLEQLKKYQEIIVNRRRIAEWYDKNLERRQGWVFPPIVDGATYSHYVVRVPDRDAVAAEYAMKGVHLGELIQYSVPHMATYQQYADGNHPFQYSFMCGKHTLNLPIYPTLRKKCLEHIVRH